MIITTATYQIVRAKKREEYGLYREGEEGMKEEEEGRRKKERDG